MTRNAFFLLVSFLITLAFTLPAMGQAIDLNNDGVFDIQDIVILTSLKGQTSSSPNYDLKADVNQDGVINFNDIIIVSQSFADPVGGGPLNFRDFYPLHVGDFWFFRSDDYPNNLDDFTRTVELMLQNGNFQIHTTSISDPQNEFREVVTPTGDLQVTQFSIVNSIVEGVVTIPQQDIIFSTPLTIAASSVEAGQAATSTATATLKAIVPILGEQTVTGTVKMVSVVSSVGDSVLLDADRPPVTLTDTITINYQSDVTATLPIVGQQTLFLAPLSAIVTFARGVGLVRLQEFTDPNTPGEVFLLRNGEVNGAMVP